MRIIRETTRPRNGAVKSDVNDKSAEEKASEEISEVLRAFKERNQDEQRRRLEATDSEFWIALCFETRAQKEEFLSKAKLIHMGDKYLDGRKVAEVLGIRLESKSVIGPLKVKRDKDWLALSTSERR